MRPALGFASLLTFVLPGATAQVREQLARLPQDQAVPMVTGLAAMGEHRRVPAPGEGTPCGLAWCGDTLWLLRGRTLLRVDPKAGTALDSLPAADWVAVTADRRFVYAASKSGEITVIDPIAGRAMQTVPPPKPLDDEVRGITVLGERLLLADTAGRVLQLSADRRTTTPFWRGEPEPTWICADHEHLVYARGGVVKWVHGRHGDILRTANGLERPLAAAMHADELWLLRASAPTDEFFVLTPYREFDCIEVCLVGVGGPGIGAPGAPPGEVMHWIVGRQRANTGAELSEILRAAKREARTTETIDGGRVPRPFVLNVHPGVTIADVITSIDAAATAGVELRTPGLADLGATRDR